MANIIRGGDAAYEATAYGRLHPTTQHFLQSQIVAPTELLTDAGQRFRQYTQHVYDRLETFSSDQYINAVRRTKEQYGDQNPFRVYLTVEEFQWVTPTVQPYLMAHPEIRELYQKQLIEGWANTYTDPEPETATKDHPHYHEVMNGIVELQDDTWTATTYWDHPPDYDLDLGEFAHQPLTFQQQVNMLHAQANLLSLIHRGGDDPTSQTGATL